MLVELGCRHIVHCKTKFGTKFDAKQEFCYIQIKKQIFLIFIKILID